MQGCCPCLPGRLHCGSPHHLPAGPASFMERTPGSPAPVTQPDFLLVGPRIEGPKEAGLLQGCATELRRSHRVTRLGCQGIPRDWQGPEQEMGGYPKQERRLRSRRQGGQGSLLWPRLPLHLLAPSSPWQQGGALPRDVLYDRDVPAASLTSVSSSVHVKWDRAIASASTAWSAYSWRLCAGLGRWADAQGSRTHSLGLGILRSGAHPRGRDAPSPDQKGAREARRGGATLHPLPSFH